MAYNRYFTNKRKSLKANQLNSSARISPINLGANIVLQKLPNKAVIDEARKTGSLSLVDFGLYDIPLEVYHINKSDKRRIGYDIFDNNHKSSWWEDVMLTKLDLSSNQISVISSDIRHLNHLFFLDLQNNNLKYLPEEICQLVQLRYLNLSKNQISTLPDSIGTLSHIQQIFLGNNLFKSLPTEFCRLLTLEVLDISSNDFNQIPDWIGNFIKLKRLSLASNKLKNLPEAILKLQALIYLDLSQNKMTEFPRLHTAPFEILKISVNSIHEFPIYRNTPSLKELHIDHNKITTLSSTHLSFIPNIDVLKVSKNNIMELPNEITNLSRLSHLDVSFNNLQSIPYSLGNMDLLTVLYIDGNPFRSINRSAITSGTDLLKRYLRNRSSTDESTNNNSNSIPTPMMDSLINVNHDNNDAKHMSLSFDAHELHSTGTLHLSNKNISTFPENFFDVLKQKNIRAVLLAHNNLEQFPMGLISCAPTMVTLDFSFNRLMDLPNIFDKFTSLTSLYLNGNYIRSLPETFKDLENSLIILDVSHNPLGLELPSVIFELVNLQHLNASNCTIVTINANNFLKLKNLSRLDLSNNEIEVIPPEFGLCHHIKTVIWEGNQIRNPALTSINQGTEAVFQYLRSQIKH